MTLKQSKTGLCSQYGSNSYLCPLLSEADAVCSLGEPTEVVRHGIYNPAGLVILL